MPSILGTSVFAYLVGTCDNSGKVPLLFILTFDNGFDYRRVVGAQIYEDVGDASLRFCQCEAGGTALSDLPPRQPQKRRKR